MVWVSLVYTNTQKQGVSHMGGHSWIVHLVYVDTQTQGLDMGADPRIF